MCKPSVLGFECVFNIIDNSCGNIKSSVSVHVFQSLVMTASDFFENPSFILIVKDLVFVAFTKYKFGVALQQNHGYFSLHFQLCCMHSRLYLLFLSFQNYVNYHQKGK